MKFETRLFLLRHAEVEASYHRIFGGRIDMELSPTGHEQAARLAAHLRTVNFDAIYASPMKRAQLTLAPLAQGRTCPVTLLDGLREVDFGAWTGLSWQEVFDRFNTSAFDWLKALEDDTIPHAENAVKFRARVEPCLRQIIADSKGRQVAVVCHGGVIRMLLAILLDLPLPKMAGFEIDYASITTVDYRPGKTEVTLLNLTPWREWE